MFSTKNDAEKNQRHFLCLMCGNGKGSELRRKFLLLRERLLQIFQLAEIERQQDHIGKEPGHGIGKAHRAEGVTAHKAESHQGPCHKLGKAGKHGGAGKAHALQTVAEDEDDGFWFSKPEYIGD